MKPKDFKDVLDAILDGRDLFIRDTGIRVKLNSFQYNKHDMMLRRRKIRMYEQVVEVEFVDKPSYKILNSCEHFSVHDNRNGKGSYIRAAIMFEKLTATPFQTPAAKVLYGKK